MSEWTNVKDELPDYSRRVLVKGIVVRIGSRVLTDRDGDKWVLEGTNYEEQRDVNYWMPLPT